LDCRNDRIEPILVGASLGAAAAVSTLCRHPDSFRAAIGLSGGYAGSCEFARCCCGGSFHDETAYLATLTGPQLERLRQRAIILGSGAGDYENPADSKRLADALGSRGISCRLDLWGPTRGHTWSTWRDMLPRLLAEQL
jgi:esterase/lipase superfamily enzyme